jgi:hypothetical protein
MKDSVAITGNTFPVREALRAMGGVWNKERKAWFVPADKAEEARRLVSTPVAKMAQSSGQAFYVRLGEGWGVCCPIQEPVGKEVSVRTKAGKIKVERLAGFIRQTPNGFVYAMARGELTANGETKFAAQLRKAQPGGMSPVRVSPVRDPGEDALDRWLDGQGGWAKCGKGGL